MDKNMSIFWDMCFEKILKYFKGDREKAELWMRTKNPMLGDVSPEEMIWNQRQVRLWKFITDALGESNDNP
jgi:hypothetical protein